MKSKTDFASPKRGTSAADELEALNAQARRKGDVTRFVEATIETKAKKRRNQEAPASSAWKST
jgi:hypothetical protein